MMFEKIGKWIAGGFIAFLALFSIYRWGRSDEKNKQNEGALDAVKIKQKNTIKVNSDPDPIDPKWLRKE